MSDLSDLETVIVNTLAQDLFPNVTYLTGSPASATAVAGSPLVRVFRGWPLASGLDADLVAGVSNVSVFSPPAMARTLGQKYETHWKQITKNVPTLMTAYSTGGVTFYGIGGAGQLVGMGSEALLPIVGATSVTYRLSASDTPQTVANFFATQFQNASVSQTTITTPTGSQTGWLLTTGTTFPVYVDVGCDQTMIMESRRQCQHVRLICWCPSPAIRDAVCGFLDQTMSQVRSFVMPDGDFTNVPVYKGTHVDDAPQKAALWRRDLIYEIEYSTTVTQTVPPALVINVSGQAVINPVAVNNLTLVR